jgi:hypothetical protein
MSTGYPLLTSLQRKPSHKKALPSLSASGIEIEIGIEVEADFDFDFDSNLAQPDRGVAPAFDAPLVGNG